MAIPNADAARRIVNRLYSRRNFIFLEIWQESVNRVNADEAKAIDRGKERVHCTLSMIVRYPVMQSGAIAMSF